MVESQIFCELKVEWELFKPTYLCVHLHLLSVEARGHLGGACPLVTWATETELRAAGLATSSTLLAEACAGPNFYSFIFKIDLPCGHGGTYHNLSLLGGRGRRMVLSQRIWGGLCSNIARLSWNKQTKKPDLKYQACVPCPSVALSTLPRLLLQSAQADALMRFNICCEGHLLLFLQRSFVISSVLSLSSDTLFKEKKSSELSMLVHTYR